MLSFDHANQVLIRCSNQDELDKKSSARIKLSNGLKANEGLWHKHFFLNELNLSEVVPIGQFGRDKGFHDV